MGVLGKLSLSGRGGFLDYLSLPFIRNQFFFLPGSCSLETGEASAAEAKTTTMAAVRRSSTELADEHDGGNMPGRVASFRTQAKSERKK